MRHVGARRFSAMLSPFIGCLALVAALGSGPAQAQVSCSAGINPTVDTDSPYFLQDIIRLNLRLSVASIQGGSEITIPEVRHKLDCDNTGLPIILELCQDEGDIVSFQGNVDTDCGVDFTAAANPADENEIIFTANPAVVLPPDSACNLSFDVRLEQVGTDITPLVVEGASGSNGVCDNDLDGLARGSVSLPITICDAELDKCVAVDTDNDGDFTDERCVGEDEFPGNDVAMGMEGQNVQWRIAVTNIGNGDLSDCDITDNLLQVPPQCMNLQIGAGGEFTCEIEGTCDRPQFINTAMVQCNVCDGRMLTPGGNPNDDPITDDDMARLECQIVKIDIRKQQEGPDVRAFTRPSDVPFEIEVCNTGSVDLNNVVVTDPLAPDCERTIGFLAAGDCFPPYTCFVNDVTTGFENEACAEGTGAGMTVEDCDPSTVEIIDIDIRKQAEGPDLRTFPAGSDVTFEVEVCNTGDEDLQNVVVSDPLVPDCDRVIGNLPAGDCIQYSCQADDVTNSFVNEICVEGDRRGTTVDDCDPSTVEVIDIDIRKQAEGPDTRVTMRGADVTFEIEVCNSGDEDLMNVVVTDELVPDCERNIGDLAAGTCAPLYDCTAPGVEMGFTNIVCVEGERNGVIVDDCDPSTVQIAEIDIRKQEEGEDSRQFPPGSDVPFEIEVCNTGEVDLNNVVVTDPRVPDCEVEIGFLAAGDCFGPYTCTDENVQEGYTNEVCVEGMAGGVTVEDCDPSTVVTEECDLVVEKTCRTDRDPTPPGATSCEGRVQTLLLEYTGLGCDASNNSQGDTVLCTGDAGLAEPVQVVVTDRRGTETYATEAGVMLGDIIEASAFDIDQQTGGPARIRPNTRIMVDGELETVQFHTSCSQPLNVGDQFGSWRVVGMTTTEGGTATLEGAQLANAQGNEACTITGLPPEPHCSGKLEAVSLRYHGRDCATDGVDLDPKDGETLSAKVDPVLTKGNEPLAKGGCQDEAVRIVCASRHDVYLDTGLPVSVDPGNVVVAESSNAGRNSLPPWIDCVIQDQFGNVLQEVSIRTQCDKINLGDRHTTLEVAALESSKAGVVRQGTNVTYHYKITNEGTTDATDVVVEDDKLGVLTPMPIPLIRPGEMVILQETALITEDTKNTVTVTGEPECFAQDMAMVEVNPPGIGCRVTGGGNDVGYQSDNRYTFGGQAGAPLASQPQPFGEWTHHQQTGSSGKFVFHAGTSSASEGTEIDRIFCSDPGWCRPARQAPTKQINFEGVGEFHNIDSGDPLLANVVAHETLHWFEVHIEDLGEPGSQHGGENSAECPPEGSFGSFASCNCLDFYHIRIYEAFRFGDPNKEDLIYEEYGYIDGGNFQIHPPTGRDQKATASPQSLLLQYMGPTIEGPVTVDVVPKDFRNDPVVHEFPNGLKTGDIVSSGAEFGTTVHANAHGETQIGDVLTVIVNGVADKLHTGAVATPLWPNQPAPMDGNDWRLGVPSSNWFVLGFEEP